MVVNMGHSRHAYKQPTEDRAYETRQVFDNIKIVIRKGKKVSSSLPPYSVTPNTIYLKAPTSDGSGQIRIYRGRNAHRDIDWGHKHNEFPANVAHVHVWRKNKEGEYKRVETRLLTRHEIRRYSKTILKCNPDIIFHIPT